MIIEKILSTIEKYVFLDIILMLLGLINSSDGMRGYPFAWLAGSNSDPGRFLMSLACVTLVVLAGDIITRVVIGLSEPVSTVQRTLDQYVSTYTEYEDPLISETRQNAAGKHSGHRSSSYENKISEDYARIRSFLNEQSKGNGRPDNNKTITVKNLLNGNKAELRNIKKKSSSSIAWWIFFIIIAILLMYW